MKTHYRKVFKSDHLGTPDLEDLIEKKQPLEFTIKEVRQEYKTKVAGKAIDANIAYFVEGIKPLVLNATNSRVVKKLAGGSPFVEDWKNIKVELYINESVKMKGEVVGGVRIKEEPPIPISKDALDKALLDISNCVELGGLSEVMNRSIKHRTNEALKVAANNKAKELKESK